MVEISPRNIIAFRTGFCMLFRGKREHEDACVKVKEWHADASCSRRDIV
jgi:hypothetical protein